MKKVSVIISLVLVIVIIGYIAYTNKSSNSNNSNSNNNNSNNSIYYDDHRDAFSSLEKEWNSNENIDSDEHTANNEPNKNENTVPETDDKPEDEPEKIVSTPIEDYDITGYKGDVDFNSLKDKKYKISNDTENGYQDWMFDYTSGDTVEIDLIVMLYNTYVDNFGKPKTFNISDKKLGEYYGNAGYYIFNIDGTDYCFLYGEDMEYVYIYKV